MNCRRAQRLLSVQQDGPLIPHEEFALSAHLAQCADCRHYQEEFQMLGRELHTLATPDRGRSLAYAAIAQWQAERGVRIGKRPWQRPALGLAAASLALLVGLGLALHTPKNPLESAMSLPAVVAEMYPEVEHNSTGLLQQRFLPMESAIAVHGVTPGAEPSLFSHPAAISSRNGSETAGAVEDMAYLNTDPAYITACWVRVPPDELAGMARRLQASVCGGDDFVNVPLPQIAGDGPRAVQAALADYKQQKEIVDARLVHKVTIGVKGIAFSDLCRQVHDQTGIEISANPSVADDKITLFCKDRPLRDLMRQINRLFGFIWTRTGEPNAYRYELSQALNAQLTEEELRNRDRNEALIALDHEMQRYRNFLSLTPEQARAQAQSAATPEDQQTLQTLGGAGWGPVHLYFGLSPDDLTALAGGQTLSYSQTPENDQERSLPPNMADGIKQGLHNMRVRQDANGGITIGGEEGVPDGEPISGVPGTQAIAQLSLNFGNVGEVSLSGTSGATISNTSTLPDGTQGQQAARVMSGINLATGISPSTKSPQNATENAKLAKDPALKSHISLEPHAPTGKQGGQLTTADVLEALYKATGKDIISDYYTRFYQPGEVTLKDVSLFDALNRLSDTMRDRWGKENDWFQFRSAGFFNDRPKEVPNRLFERWAESQRTHGAFTVEDFIGIAQLTDMQLNADTTAQGAQLLFGLKQWRQVKSMRSDWQFFGKLPSALRQAALTKKGLLYDQLPLRLRPTFLNQLFGPAVDKLQLEGNDLATASLTVEYALPDKPSGAEGTSPPEPKFSYNVTGRDTLGNWNRVVTPTSESTVTPNGQSERRSRQ